ncbi:hypothetical protein ACFRQM_15820 [Streptomyces sp. NPDC056831]|uniref:hypothetical protein n=1 Tax=Streptomyces sp. NPDC056831 TaxID=3345954 RepID=UPI0036A166B6
MREYGERVNHKKTARAMRQVGLAGLRLRRRHRTTVADSDPCPSRHRYRCRDSAPAPLITRRTALRRSAG